MSLVCPREARQLLCCCPVVVLVKWPAAQRQLFIARHSRHGISVPVGCHHPSGRGCWQQAPKLKSLGVTVDSHLRFDCHTRDVARTCNYHTRALRLMGRLKIRVRKMRHNTAGWKLREKMLCKAKKLFTIRCDAIRYRTKRSKADEMARLI